MKMEYKFCLAGALLAAMLPSQLFAASGCYVTGTSIPANTYFVDAPLKGPFFSVSDNGGGHIHLVTQTPGYEKFIFLSPGVRFLPDPRHLVSKAYIRVEYVVTPYREGPFFFITRNNRGKASRKEIQPKSDLNKAIINTVETRLNMQKVTQFELLSSRHAWLKRICWADKRSEFPPVLTGTTELANMQGLMSASEGNEERPAK